MDNVKKKVTYIYVRHGETIFNLQDRMQGVTDSPMTEFGKQQVRSANIALQDIHFTKAFVSPLGRTRDAAKILLEGRNLEAVAYDGLKEFNYGILDGTSKDPNDLDMVRRLRTDFFQDIGGDSRSSMDLRIRKTFEYLNEQCEDGDMVLLVSHGSYYRHMMRALFAYVMPGTLDDDAELIDGGGISLLQYNNGGLDLLKKATTPSRFKVWYSEHLNEIYE